MGFVTDGRSQAAADHILSHLRKYDSGVDLLF